MRTNRKEYQNELSVLEDLRNKTDLLRPFDILERILTKHKGRGRFLSRLGPEAKDGIDSLLSIALEYEAVEVPSLVGFIAWVRDKDIEIKRQMDNAQNQVRVMTVHGSKGLEAPIVILPDTLDRRADVRGHFFDADDLVVWSGTKNDRPAAIAELYDLCFEKEKEERNRLLYVAMTRAEKWLIVAGAGKVQNASECWHSQITEGIEAAGGVRLTTPVGNGRRLEYGNWPVLQNANVEKTAKNQVELPTWLQNSPANQEERSVLISPSELPGSKALPSDVNWDSETAKNYGSYVHLLLENLPVHPTENWPQIANNLRVKLEQPIDENIALHAYESAKQALGTPDLSWIFEKDAFAEVPFVTVLPEYSERCFHGIIDRLIVQDETVFVVDFKTNRAIPETAEQIPIGILNQMVIYEHAIKQLYQKYAIKTGILWTAEAKFMEIPQRILLDAKTNLCKS
jgi:ATP-dependent helicase/nuclease subunit A